MAGLMNSALDIREIREVAEEVVRDSTFSERFSTILNSVVAGFLQNQLKKPVIQRTERSRGSAAAEMRDGAVAELLHYFARLRLSKEEMVARLRGHPALAGWKPKLTLSAQQIIRSASRQVPREQWAQLLAVAAAGHSRADPFLDELSSKSRKRDDERQ